MANETYKIKLLVLWDILSKKDCATKGLTFRGAFLYAKNTYVCEICLQNSAFA